MGETVNTIRDLLITTLVLFAYMLPTVVASSRHHRNASAIGVLNILLGWTGIGWIAALVWASTNDIDTTKTVWDQRTRTYVTVPR